jgi:diguanylate cyclase (GGDEF)-like protein
VHPDDQDMLDEAIRKENLMEALEREDTFTLTYRLMMEGEPVYVHMKATKLDDKNDTHIVIGISNVNEQIKRELENDSALRKAKERAERDALTGVKSKYAFAEAEKNLNREILEGSAEGFAIAVCDLNRLKEVNDTHGHKAGDEYIKQACHIICTVFRHSPVYRIGGDEFAVILKGRDFEHRELLAERIRENSIKHLEDGVVIAIGIAEYDPALDQAVASMFERADAAMYDNKKYLKGEQNV